MTDEEKLGTLGEIYYQALFGGLLAEDKYDGEKDLIQTDGKRVEIKTQCRFRFADAFTVNKAHKNNLKKCLYVDRLIFIEYSLSEYILIWECTDRRSVYTTTVNNIDGTQRVMACWPIEKMTLLMKVKHPKLAQMMREYTKSQSLGYYE